MADTDTAAWRGLLDELDRQLVRARRPLGLVTEPSGIWPMAEILSSFGPLGGMPEEFADRARRILVECEAEIERIRLARRAVADHLAVLDSVRQQNPSTPVYLDRVG